MPHSCAVKTCQNKARTGTCLSFHRLPVREPERLNLWLFALNIDINTPQEELRKYIVCSEHFFPEDYTANGQPGTGRMHRFLTPTAVPTVGVSSCSPQLSVTEDSEDDRIKHAFLSSHSSEETKLVSEEQVHALEETEIHLQVKEVLLQQCDVKVEKVPNLEETEINPRVKEEQVDQFISPDTEASNNAEVRHVKSEPTTKCELFPSSNAVTVGINDSTDDKWNESDGSSSPHQSNGIEVFVELEQPPSEEKSCHICVRVQTSTFAGKHRVSRCSAMSGTQLLRVLVNERLAAAAEEIFGLVEKTLAEYQDEVVRSKREIIQLKQEIEQLSVVKAEMSSFRADTQSVSEEAFPSQQPDQIPTVEEIETHDDPHQVKEEQVDLCIIPDLEADSSEDEKVRLYGSTTTTQTDCQLFPTFSAITVTLDDDDEWNGSDGSCGPSHSDASLTEQEQAQRDEKACRFCGKQFNRDSALIRHMDETHTGEKAFKCSKCDKTFAQSLSAKWNPGISRISPSWR
ncbi:zinc finger protein 568-like protein [Lates japonicus]|uniref:Zinc finger protein 568-like protein n=1 Tax=Lates japonicus TaxID=270547 RepID=A0AAD3RIJ8_LATJO|nr:zinc finger protein 568-like protein [Lates japonicus]